jgi:hypothetical protein
MEWKLIRHAFRKWEKDINKHFVNNIRGVSWRNANKVFTKKEKLEMRSKKKRTPRQAIQTELAL